MKFSTVATPESENSWQDLMCSRPRKVKIYAKFTANTISEISLSSRGFKNKISGNLFPLCCVIGREFFMQLVSILKV